MVSLLSAQMVLEKDPVTATIWIHWLKLHEQTEVNLGNVPLTEPLLQVSATTFQTVSFKREISQSSAVVTKKEDAIPPTPAKDTDELMRKETVLCKELGFHTSAQLMVLRAEMTASTSETLSQRLLRLKRKEMKVQLRSSRRVLRNKLKELFHRCQPTKDDNHGTVQLKVLSPQVSATTFQVLMQVLFKNLGMKRACLSVLKMDL